MLIRVCCCRREFIRWGFSGRGKYAKSFQDAAALDSPVMTLPALSKKVGGKVTKFKVGDSCLCFHFNPEVAGGYAGNMPGRKQNQAAFKAGDDQFLPKAAGVPSVALDGHGRRWLTRPTFIGPDGLNSWRRRGGVGIIRDSDCKDSRRESDRNCFDCQSGFSQATRCRL